MRQLDNNETSAGFTLLELSLVIIISGIIFIALLGIAKTYIHNTQQEKLSRLIETAKLGLVQYQAALKKYPCPARAELPKTDPNYGKADCTITPGGVGGTILTGILPRDKNLNVVISNFETLQTNLLDPWDRPLIYAVTKDLSEFSPSSVTPFNINGGKIDVRDESGSPTGGVKGDGHFVVLSMGQDNVCPTTGYEAENCNGDEKFISSIQYGDAGPTHFDDTVGFFVGRQASLWSNIKNSTVNVKNDNVRNIGIGTNTPAEKLNVVGTVNVSGQVMSQRICDDGTTNCIKPDSLYKLDCSTATVGAPGKYISAITINPVTNELKATCEDLIFKVPTTEDKNCTFGIQGMFTDGNVKCAEQP